MLHSIQTIRAGKTARRAGVVFSGVLVLFSLLSMKPVMALAQGTWDPDLSRGRMYLEPEQGDRLPSQIGAMSIDSSRRAMSALMRDWTDDNRQVKWRWIVSCGASVAKGTLHPFIVAINQFNLGVHLFLKNFDYYFPKAGPTHAGRVSEQLRKLASLVELSPEERRALDRLFERDEYAVDDTDKIRLAIDSQWFLIRVANRVYNERADYHLKRTEGFWGFFRFEEEMCKHYSIRRERNDTLLRAGQAVLEGYDHLQHALDDEWFVR